jgi:hypothetical protein
MGGESGTRPLTIGPEAGHLPSAFEEIIDHILVLGA